MVEVVLVLLAPLLLVALGRLELLLGSQALRVRLRNGVLAGGGRSPHREEADDEEWDGDGDKDQDGEHVRSLLARNTQRRRAARDARSFRKSAKSDLFSESQRRERFAAVRLLKE